MRRRIRKKSSGITVQCMEGSIADIIHEADMSVRKVTRHHTVIEPKKETINTTSNVTRKNNVGRILFIGGCSVLFCSLLYAYTYKKN